MVWEGSGSNPAICPTIAKTVSHVFLQNPATLVLWAFMAKAKVREILEADAGRCLKSCVRGEILDEFTKIEKL